MAKENQNNEGISPTVPGSVEKNDIEIPQEAEPISELEARLNAEREGFMQAEQNRDKYLRASDDSVEKIAAESVYNQAKGRYERARAETVGGNINLFLQEETKLADGRILAATEKNPGAWEKISGAYKWLGEQNLEKLGWKPEGKFKRIIARGANARMAIGASLLGIGIFAPPVFFLTLGAKRAMSGVGAAVFTNDWLKATHEAALTTISEEKLNSIPPGEIQSYIGEMIVGLRMQGKLASESADFQRLMTRYEEVLKKEYETAENTEYLIIDASNSIYAGLDWAQKREKLNKIFRGITSFSAGALAAVGVDVARYLSGAENAGIFSAVKAPVGHLPGQPPAASSVPDSRIAQGVIKQPVAEMPKPPSEPAPAPKIEESATGQPDAKVPTPDSGAQPSELQPSDGKPAEGVGQESSQKPSVETKAADATDKRAEGEIKPQAGQSGAPEADASRAPAASAGAVAENAATPNTSEVLETDTTNSIEITVQAGEGPIHEARKAISEYIALSGDEQLKGLTKAQRILAEEKLYRAIKDSLPEWKVGATVSFDKDIIEKTLGEVGGQTQEQIAALDKNLAPFVDKVKWSRYDVQLSAEGDAIHKPWDYDEGIRRAARPLTAVTEGTVANPGGADLKELILRPEDTSHIPLGIDGEADSPADLRELILQEQENIAKVEAFKGIDPSLADEISRESQVLSVGETAALDSAIERTARTISRIYPEEYQAIKGLKISDVLKLGYFGNSPETVWPSVGEPNQVGLIKKMKLRDSFMAVMKALSPEERGSTSNMTIHQFIRTYYQDRISERSFA